MSAQAVRNEQDVSDQAIDWLVLLHSGRADAADRQAFARWRAADPAHEAAAREAEALWSDVGATPTATQFTPGDDTVLPFRPKRGIVRRTVLAGSMAASLALMLSGVSLSGLFADYSTGIGESRRVALPDGSVITLNTATALSVDYSTEARHVTLLEGEAMFEVAKDASRPFIVSAGEGTARAVGTVYGVRRHGSGAGVTVAEGVVEVAVPGSVPLRLTHDQRAAYGDGPLLAQPADTESETAWRRGKLIFNRRPLEQVMGEFGRYHRGRIVVADKELSALEITGVFDVADADGLFRSIGQSLNVRVVRLPLLTIIY